MPEDNSHAFTDIVPASVFLHVPTLSVWLSEYPPPSEIASERKTIITSLCSKFNGGKHDAHGTLKLAHTFTLLHYHCILDGLK